MNIKTIIFLSAGFVFFPLTIIAAPCPIGDPGHPNTRAHVDFKKGESTAECRLVGNWGPGTTFVKCTVSDNATGACDTKPNPPSMLTDPGYPSSQKWNDMNADGYIDLCRTVGDPPHTFTRCNMGPSFSDANQIDY
jgi:hypothetical protein